jgi:hypothetical protein
MYNVREMGIYQTKNQDNGHFRLPWGNLLPMLRVMSKSLPLNRCVAVLCLLFGACRLVGASDGVHAGVAAQPVPAMPNLIVGTQAIGGPYQFTDDAYLLEVAREIEGMGSNLIKFAVNPRKYTKRPYFHNEVSGVDSMVDLLVKHPVYKEVMGMDFRFYHIWANPYAQTRWQDGVNESEAQALYNEFYELATYLLTEFKGTGKVFFLGHWEGDWLLQGAMDPNVDATPERIRGFAQYLNIRQCAINDVRSKIPNDGVWVYHYTEVNQVWKGIDGSRPTLTNSVLPLVDVDFVSYSSYDVLYSKNMREDLHRALDHIESQLKPRSDISGKRVFVGEYAIKAAGVKYDPQAHDRRNREVTRAILEWGCPFALYWQFYCNEPRGDGYEGYWLVDDQQVRYPLYDTFESYYTGVKQFVAESIRRTGKAPSDAEIRTFAIKHFN